MLHKNKRVIFVGTNSEFMNDHYYRRLWIAARNLPISRRAWLDEISLALLRFNGEILYKSGQPFPIPEDIDEIFGNDFDARWMSDYLKSDPTGLRPLAISRKKERVQLIDLYFRVKYPHIARHFGR